MKFRCWSVWHTIAYLFTIIRMVQTALSRAFTGFTGAWGHKALFRFGMLSITSYSMT